MLPPLMKKSEQRINTEQLVAVNSLPKSSFQLRGRSPNTAVGAHPNISAGAPPEPGVSGIMAKDIMDNQDACLDGWRTPGESQ